LLFPKLTGSKACRKEPRLSDHRVANVAVILRPRPIDEKLPV
jgi:hypothetical protein